jgi:hypothetical protein
MDNLCTAAFSPVTPAYAGWRRGRVDEARDYRCRGHDEEQNWHYLNELTELGRSSSVRVARCRKSTGGSGTGYVYGSV